MRGEKESSRESRREKTRNIRAVEGPTYNEYGTQGDQDDAALTVVQILL